MPEPATQAVVGAQATQIVALGEADVAELADPALAGEPETLAEEVRSEMLLRRERRHRMLLLRRRGYSYDEIARLMSNNANDPGYSITKPSVQRVIVRYLNQLDQEDSESVEQLRGLENERLDELLKVWEKKARDGDPKAAGIVLNLMARRAKMNGLDAPKKHEHEHHGSVLHELGADPDEIRREQEAFEASYGDPGIAELPPGDVTELPDA